MAVQHTACRHCEQDIEGHSPYRAGEWRDRGGETHCSAEYGSGAHAPHDGKVRAAGPGVCKDCGRHRTVRLDVLPAIRYPLCAECAKAYEGGAS